MDVGATCDVGFDSNEFVSIGQVVRLSVDPYDDPSCDVRFCSGVCIDAGRELLCGSLVVVVVGMGREILW